MSQITIPQLPQNGGLLGTELLEISNANTSEKISVLNLSAIYQLISEKDVANGYAGLDGNIKLDVDQISLLIPAINIANGTVDNTEYQSLAGVTGPIQTQLDGKEDTTNKNAANGYAGLDANIKLAVAQIPLLIPAINIADGTVDNNEFQFLNGVTSLIQTQLNAREETANKDTANGYAGLDANTLLVVAQIPSLIPAINIADGTVDNTEYQSLSGVTSAIQGQLDAKEEILNKGAASGYAGLDGDSFLLLANYPAGTSLQVLRRNTDNDALEFSTIDTSGIASINGDTTAAQTFLPGTGLMITNVGATHTYSINNIVVTLTDNQVLLGKTMSGITNTFSNINETQQTVSVGATNTVLTSNGVGNTPTYKVIPSNQTPWLDNIEAGEHNLSSLGVLTFANNSALPVGEIAILGTTTGMILNVSPNDALIFSVNADIQLTVAAGITKMNSRFELKKAVTTSSFSSGASTLNTEGNLFAFSNSSGTFNSINTTDWQEGSIIYLQFPSVDATGVTIVHGAGATQPQASFWLLNENNYTVDDSNLRQILSFMYDGTYWVQQSFGELTVPISSQTPWVSNIDGDRYTLDDAVIHFTDNPRVTPSATEYAMYATTTTDPDALIINWPANLELRLHVNGAEEYTFDSDILQMHQNSIQDLLAIQDENSNEQLTFVSVTSAENHIKITNATSSNPARIETDGLGSNVGLVIGTKGSGVIEIESDVQIDESLVIFKRLVTSDDNSPIASATSITLGDGNYFKISGSVSISYISEDGWFAGSTITLQFLAALTVLNDTGSVPPGFRAIAMDADFAVNAGDTLTLTYDGVHWRRIANSDNSA